MSQQRTTNRQRAGWERLRGGCGGVWRHVSGCTVWHCGHPTANWPYFGLRPDGDQRFKSEMLLTGGWGLGRGFQLLKQAQEAVEREAAKETKR